MVEKKDIIKYNVNKGNDVMKKSKVVFMGTPEFSVPVLEMLIEKCEVLMVVTQPDSEVGRKKILTPSPVKLVALEHGIPVMQPERIRKDFDWLKRMDIDLIITCAYGQILPQELLDIPHYGSINVHASLLPKYRGSAPINWAIMNGDTETGISLMYMDAGMDTGDIIDTIRVKINQDETYGELYKTLSILGKNMLESNLDYLVSGKVKRLKQDEEFASMAPMIKRNIEKIDFKENGQRIIDKIRGLNPEPLAYFLLDGEEIKIAKANFLKEDAVVGKIYVTKKSLAIGCIDGKINLLTIKKSGKKEMDIKSFLNGVNQEKIINSIIQ